MQPITFQMTASLPDNLPESAIWSMQAVPDGLAMGSELDVVVSSAGAVSLVAPVSTAVVGTTGAVMVQNLSDGVLTLTCKSSADVALSVPVGASGWCFLPSIDLSQTISLAIAEGTGSAKVWLLYGAIPETT